jgi:hypothetical protein
MQQLQHKKRHMKHLKHAPEALAKTPEKTLKKHCNI